MVASFNRIDLCGGSKIFDVRMNLVRRAESITRALNEQHRLANMFQMFNAKLRGLTGRVKWITEKHQTRNFIYQTTLSLQRAITCDAIRPPIDFPPTTNRLFFSFLCLSAVSITARKQASNFGF